MSRQSPMLLELRANFDPKAAHERDLRAAIRDELYRLSFHAFEQLVKDLLTRLGYSDANLLGRTEWRQFTRHGGIDMEAYANVGLSRSRIVLQIKQYRRNVSRRFIDELAGVILRIGAREGIVITMSQFSRVAKQAAKAFQVASVRLIDGDELVSLLLERKMGIKQAEQDGEPWTEMDAAYFAGLREKYPAKNRSPASGVVKDQVLLPLEPTSPRIDSLNHPSMLWRTHFLAGVNSLWLLYPLPGVLTAQTLPLSVGMVALGSLLPDLDAFESKVKNLGAFGITPFAPISRIAFRSLGHRGILHSPFSLIPVAVIAAFLSIWIGVVPGISLILGYGSHLVMDALTRSGISLLPFSEKRLYLLPPHLRFITGSVQEDALMLVLGLLAMLLLLHFLPFVGNYP